MEAAAQSPALWAGIGLLPPGLQPGDRVKVLSFDHG